MNKIAKVIRILTVAPLMASYLLIIVYFCNEETRNTNFLLGFVFLTLLPISAYPVQKIIPVLKSKGRNCQRNMAMIFAMVGYILGIVVALITNASKLYMVLYLTYLLSGLLMIIFNKLKIKFSGHACGVAGTIIFLAFFVTPYLIIPGLILIYFVYYASIAMKRHTLIQLTGGATLSILSFLISYMVIIG